MDKEVQIKRIIRAFVINNHYKGVDLQEDWINDAAEEIVKIFAIPVVMQRSELLLFADYSESDKTSQTTDECVDNYLAQKKQ